jgi:flagellar FliL protein
MANVEPEETSANKPAGSMLGRFLIAAFLGAVVISECLFAYFWLPSAQEVAAEVEKLAKEANAGAESSAETPQGEATSVVEVDLGNFTITNHRLPTEATFRTDFHLFGTVAEEDRDEFTRVFQRNEHRFRDQVIVEIRNCEVSDLEDAGLGLIKRRFLAKSNALFGKPLLRSIIFADYTFVEL